MNAPSPEHVARVMAQRKLFRKMLGRVLNEQRVRKGMSQEKVASEACLSRTQIHKSERGTSNEGIDTVQSICDVIDLDFGAAVSQANFFVTHPQSRPQGKLLHLPGGKKRDVHSNNGE